MKCTEISNHLAVYQELTNSVLGQLHFKNKLIEKVIRYLVTWGEEEAELDECGRKVQASSYKINKH